MNNFKELNSISQKIRYELVRISHEAQSSHIGGSLSCVDILVTLYWCILNIDHNNYLDSDRDRLIFSKGHAVSSLYATLAIRGFFPINDLRNYNKPHSSLPEQPSIQCKPGVEWATGSSGHGLGIALGMALGAKINNKKYSVYAILSDGECQEGSTWEAAMLAPRLNLGRLIAIIDYNKWQATGRPNDVMSFEPFKSKWESFGWNCIELDGHDITALYTALSDNKESQKPLAIIAHTIKGKGVSFMEDNNNWHYRSPTLEELNLAKIELGII